MERNIVLIVSILLALSYLTSCGSKAHLSNGVAGDVKKESFDQTATLNTNWLKDLNLKDVNGGVPCAACAIIVGLVEQLTAIYNISVADAIDKLCGFLPTGFHESCQLIVQDFAPAVIKLLEAKETPDVVCHAIDLCKNETGQFCHLFPLPESELSIRVAHARKKARLALLISTNGRKSRFEKLKTAEKPFSSKSFIDYFFNLCNVSVIKPICKIINNFANGHLPVDDLDGDLFSDAGTMRGYYWRGKDCNDLEKNVYPGRYSEDDSLVDTNCNGISGVDPDSGETYESLWCKGSPGRMGTIILGDSAGAHFHIPPSWVTSKDIGIDTYKDLLFVLENEFDWPMLSSSTGFMNSTWPSSITGPVDSGYLRMRKLNLCNHRDYQNIAVNGARAHAMADGISKGFARRGKEDVPVYLTLALIGNDVCNGHPGMDHMTKPEDFYTYTLETLRYVDQIVAPGSVVVGIGLADGRILYDYLHNRIHPIGSLRGDVSYAQFYDYFNCLQVSPCFGWMNSNETWRNRTTERAQQLNTAFKGLVANQTFKNFKAYYFDPPISSSIAKWIKMGREPWELIEPVDGFHPSQIGNAFNTKVMFELMDKENVLPKEENPFNKKIREKFGDQGGYL